MVFIFSTFFNDFDRDFITKGYIEMSLKNSRTKTAIIKGRFKTFTAYKGYYLNVQFYWIFITNSMAVLHDFS